MNYRVIQNFKNRKSFYKIQDSYHGPDAEMLLSQGLIKQVEDPKPNAEMLMANGLIKNEDPNPFEEVPLTKKSKKKKE